MDFKEGTVGGAPGSEAPGPLQLVVMCYDAVIGDLRQAKGFQQGGSVEEARGKVLHAQDVVTELLVGLDYEQGGALAQNLGRIYNYMLRRMIGITGDENGELYDELIAIMEGLKTSWEQIQT